MYLRGLDFLPAILVLTVTAYFISIWQCLLFALLMLVGAVLSRLLSIQLRDVGHNVEKHEFVLEGFPVSPYVEKIRWTMDKLGVDYREERDYGVMLFLRGRSVPCLHFKRKDHWSLSTISNSADIAAYLAGRFLHDTERVSFLVDALRSPRTAELEALCDDLMHQTRRLIYWHVLQREGGLKDPSVCRAMWGAKEPGVPEWQLVVGRLMQPFQNVLIRKFMRLESPTCQSTCLSKINEIFDKLAAEVQKNEANLTLLNTAEPTYVDFCVAAAVALATQNVKYGAGACAQSLNEQLMAQVPSLDADLKPLRDHFIADWADKMYSEHRGKWNAKL